MNPRHVKFGFARTRRLRTSSQFRELVRTGQKSQDSFFVVHARPNGLDHGRIGITVSRRVSASAVDRNRIKRKIRETFRQDPIRFCGVDLVVTARPAVLKAGVADVLQSLQQHWSAIQKACKP